jgi:predicted RNA-binding protein with PUA-like domain
MYYLLKTEPSEYSYQALERERQTVWNGVTNPQAVKNLRQMKPGDRLIVYHTGGERRVAGTARVVSVDASDPTCPLVTIAAGDRVKHPVTLADIKQSARFAGSPLVRQPRLSVVPLTEAHYRALLKGEL